ncbi:unnamed protein product [Aphanomyces euteiches]|uniref:MI domain-containing protein n=1 Tax=Aphanomyces euteiches TaxID=100861 RepID=A0A6G0XG25_9STRA|nr:hypothetical protein Ae201684_005194 [Aphanomyces euteiches]KAH9053426.1 hypothetical protein Ae201684P_015195 [Aphanomyces euteiches]KAH9131796.1 hypothetical protein AeRB84_021631 [Aphanomyces euteiches]
MSASRRRNSKENSATQAAYLDPEKAAMEEEASSGGVGSHLVHTVEKSATEVLPELPTRDRSKSRELSKKQGGGKKGLWGKPEDIIDLPKDDKNDPNFDSEEEAEKIILVASDATSGSSPLSPTSRSLAKVTLFEGNVRAFGASPVPDTVKKQIEAIVNEYFSSSDTEEVRLQLSELSGDTDGLYNYELVKRAITMSMDKHEREREWVSRLLSELYLNGLTPVELSQGFRRVLVSADDLALDIPTAVNMLSIFAARAIVDEILPPRFLEDPILTAHSPVVVQEAVKKLSINHGTVRMEKGWGPGDGRPVEELKVAIDQLTKEYLLSGDLEEAATCVRELNVAHFHHEVVKRGIINSFEEGKEYCNAMGSLLAFLVSQEIVSSAQLRKGFDKVALVLPDLELDVPGARKLLAALVDRAKSDGILPQDYSA